MSKFSSDLDEKVYEVSLDTSAVCQEYGNVTEQGIWRGLVDLTITAGRGVDDLADIRLELDGAFWAIVSEDSQGFVDIDYFDVYDTAATAWCALQDDYEDNRGPEEWDSIISEDRGTYYVTLEGGRGETFDTQDDAERGLAQMMADAGTYGDAFYVNERGNTHRVDEEVRAWHDAGGDKMHPAAYWGDEMVRCEWERGDSLDECACAPVLGSHFATDDKGVEVSRRLIDAYNVVRVFIPAP